MGFPEASELWAMLRRLRDTPALLAWDTAPDGLAALGWTVTDRSDDDRFLLVNAEIGEDVQLTYFRDELTLARVWVHAGDGAAAQRAATRAADAYRDELSSHLESDGRRSRREFWTDEEWTAALSKESVAVTVEYGPAIAMAEVYG